MLKLYSYFRSSASYRVRLALHWKRAEFEYRPVSLLKDEQRAPEFVALNPTANVPLLVDGVDFAIGETIAIIDYLDHLFPERRLFPLEARARARVLQVCEVVNSGIQPLQNLKLTQALEREFGFDKSKVNAWVRRWVEPGLDALEKIVRPQAGTCAFGDEISAADCYVIPQLFSARRFGVATDHYPTLARVEAAALDRAEFKAAHPDQQPDCAPRTA